MNHEIIKIMKATKGNTPLPPSRGDFRSGQRIWRSDGAKIPPWVGPGGCFSAGEMSWNGDLIKLFFVFSW